jgi:site-specific recombinase XerD
MTEPFLAPFIRSFFQDHLVCQRNASRNTIMSYRDGIKLFVRDVAGRLRKPVAEVRVTDVSEPLMLAFLADLEQRRGNTIQTRNQRLIGLRRLFDYIAWRDPLLMDHCRLLRTIPCKRGEVRPEIGYLEKHEVAAILQTAKASGNSAERDYSLLLFMYNTGARVQEAADARRSWLSLHNPYKVQLLGKGRKLRTCPLWESTAIQLRQLLDQHGSRMDSDPYLFVNRFGHPLSRSGIADVIHRHVRQAAKSIPSLGGRRVTPHTFRHTTAMHLLQSGVEVNVIRSWLGHVNIATTNRYIEIDLAMKAKALKACEISPSPMSTVGPQINPGLLAWLASL